MRINPTRIGLNAGSIHSHAFISLALILGLSLPSARETPTSEKDALGDSHQVRRDLKTHKIESRVVLTLALTNSLDMKMDGAMDGAYVSHKEKTVQLLLQKEGDFERKKTPPNSIH